ncbi:MAG: LptF/LptG family permease [Kiritimatiellia bacterium]
MDKLSKYIATDFLITFFMTLLIFTFVMCVGAMIKAIDLLARGVSAGIIIRVFLQNIPYILTFSIPISTLTASLLIFGRLSMDGELMAMKASGLTMWQIICPVVLLSIVLSAVCVYLNNYAAPRAHFGQRQLLRDVGVEEPVHLLEEGRFVQDFPGMMIYVGKKDRNKVKDVIVYEMDKHGIRRNVRAKSGEIRADEANKMLLIDLYEVRIDQPDPEDPMDIVKTRHLTAKHYPVQLDFAKLWQKDAIRKKMTDMTGPEIKAAIRNIREAFPTLKEKDVGKQRMKMLVTANKRLSLSISCFAFTLIAIPLGITSRRKESSAGVGISLLLMFVFYLFIIIADSLVGHPALHPDFIVWIPIIAAEIGGFMMIGRMN